MDPAENTTTVRAAILAGCFIAFISFGFVVTFGVFLKPISDDLGWGREVFSLSMAVQLLSWGVAMPFTGMLADRYGSARILAVGAVISAVGFFLRGAVADPTVFILSGVVVGIGTVACSFQIVTIALGKVVPAERRSFVFGLGTASASAGMFAAAPISSWMIASFGWQNAIFVVAASFLLALPACLFIARVSVPTAPAGSDQNFRFAIATAFQDRAYVLLFFGFYVCGFHVAFIQTHLPANIIDEGLPGWIGAWSLALIGLFNIAGSLAAGWSGQVYSKKNVLAGIYFARAVVILIFLTMPMTQVSVLVFSAAMGVLWLSTIPLTTALVAQTQGLSFLSTLVGLVFVSHQLGSFTGAWLGGRIYDLYQDYTLMWWAAVALGLLATLLHLPIRETPGKLARETNPG